MHIDCHIFAIAFFSFELLLLYIALASIMPGLVFPDTFWKDKDNIASVLLDLPDCLSGPHSIMECVSPITGADVVTQAVISSPTMSLHQLNTLFLSILATVKANLFLFTITKKGFI